MECPNSQFENREGAKFCNECGHRFEPDCPDCGTTHRVGSKFCDECGYSSAKDREAPTIVYMLRAATYASRSGMPSSHSFQWHYRKKKRMGRQEYPPES